MNAPGDLGMCITTEGMSSDKPPTQWLKPVYKFVFCYPHIVTLTAGNEAVLVYRYVVLIFDLFLFIFCSLVFFFSFQYKQIMYSICKVQIF